MRFNNLTKMVKSNEILNTDNFYNFCSTDEKIIYWKRDFLFKPGIWRGAAVNAFTNYLKEIDVRTLVLGHSDIYTGWPTSLYLRILGLDRLYGTNLRPFRNFAFSIPLGVTNDSSETQLHSVLGDNELFLEADSILEIPSKFEHSIYININTNNNVKARNEMLNAIKLHNSVIIESPSYSKKGRVNYLSKLRKYNLVPCPEGNGVDTHRLWETIYMGGTPIVKSHPALNSLIDELPVIVVKDWHEILDGAQMEEKWNLMQEGIYKFEKLSMTYWRAKISTANSKSITMLPENKIPN